MLYLATGSLVVLHAFLSTLLVVDRSSVGSEFLRVRPVILVFPLARGQSFGLRIAIGDIRCSHRLFFGWLRAALTRPTARISDTLRPNSSFKPTPLRGAA